MDNLKKKSTQCICGFRMILGINLTIFLNSTTPIVICNGVEGISVTSGRIFKSLMHFTLDWINQHTLRIKNTYNIINNSHCCSQGVDQSHTTASHPPASTPNKDTIMYNADSKIFFSNQISIPTFVLKCGPLTPLMPRSQTSLPTNAY